MLAACFSSGALAITEFEFGDGWQGSWLTTVSLGTSIRAQEPNRKLYGQANGALVGLTNGLGANTIDEGNLNYRKGDSFSTPFKILSEVSFRKDSFGGLIRAKAWYDYTLKDGDVKFGNQPNGYNGYDPATNSLGARRPLSDRDFDPLLKFSGIALLDAYVYDTFDGVAGNPIQLRAGRHVLNWGESVFIQGVNQINPIDVPAARRPGAELKEVFMPIWLLSGSQSLGDLGAIEAFYQLKWEPTPIEAGCGNYWAVAEGNISTRPGGCFNATAIPPHSTPSGLASGAYVGTIEGKKAKNSGQFGVAYRFTSDALDTEFGVYGMNIHSRTPVFSLKYGSFPGTQVINAAGTNMAAFWEYPEDVKVFGISAATNIKGWSVSAEFSQTRDVRAQLDGNDMFNASFGAGPMAALAAGEVASLGALHGGVKTNKNQIQLNALQAGNRFMGADQWLVVGEVGFQWNDLPTGANDPRINRPFIFGAGPHPAYGGSTCGAGGNLSPDGCSLNAGYVTKNAWGYRLLGQLTFNNVFGSGVAAAPRVFWSHDVSGYAVDSQFVEDRQALGLGVKFSYAKKYTLDVSYNTFNDNAKFDPLRDRDYLSAVFSANF